MGGDGKRAERALLSKRPRAWAPEQGNAGLDAEAGEKVAGIDKRGEGGGTRRPVVVADHDHIGGGVRRAVAVVGEGAYAVEGGIDGSIGMHRRTDLRAVLVPGRHAEIGGPARGRAAVDMRGRDDRRGSGRVQAEVDGSRLPGRRNDALVVVADVEAVLAGIRPKADGRGRDEGLVGRGRALQYRHGPGDEGVAGAERIQNHGGRR